jgi:hypothetical protein
MEIEFPLVLNIILIVSILLTTVLWEFSVLNKNHESDFKMQSQRKVIGIFELINAFAWTILLSFNIGDFKDTIFLILIFWTFPMAELIMWFVYKKKKPFTIFIKENELILNKRWTQKRNLTELTQIQFDRLNKNLKLDFQSKSGISIKTTEYKIEEIQTLLGILIEQSKNEVFRPKNYHPKIKNSN